MIGIKKYTLATLCVTALLTTLPTKTAIQFDGVAVGIVEGIACHLIEKEVLSDQGWYVKYPVSWIGVKIPTHLFTSTYLSSTKAQIARDNPRPTLIPYVSSAGDSAADDYLAYKKKKLEKARDNERIKKENNVMEAEYKCRLFLDPNYQYVNDFGPSRRIASWLTYLSLKIYDAYQQKKQSQEKLAAESSESVCLKG